MEKAVKSMRHRRLDASAWSKILVGYEKSGQSAKIYCTTAGISLASFYYWRRRLSEGIDSAEPSFSAIEISSKPVGEVLVELPGGILLRFPELPPVSYLRSLSTHYTGI